MGRILRGYYEYVFKVYGLETKNKLGIMTKISSIVAPITPDTPENIELFKESIKKITGVVPPNII